MKISILVPAHNEEKSISECIDSCLDQTRPPDEIIVVNDGSTDTTPILLAFFGDAIKVVDVYPNTGNKSKAQQIGLSHITGDVFIATDADTLLDTNFVQRVEDDFLEDPSIVAVGGYIKSMRHNWLTACREMDYVIGQNFHKVAQAYINSLFVIPGCAGAFRTDAFRKHITFDHDTLTEDLDFTYKINKEDFTIHYDRKAVVYTQDPSTIHSYVNQMRRWYAGGWQNIRKHFDILRRPATALELSLIYAEGFIYSILLFVVPLINIQFFFFLMIPFFTYSTALGIYAAVIRRRLDVLVYSPLYIVLLYINAYVFITQFFREIVLLKKNMYWFKPERRAIA